MSEDKFDEACLQLDIPNDEQDKIVWDSINLQEIFNEYGWHERKPVINNPYSMNLDKEIVNFYEYNDSSGCGVDYNIPTDNEWGDLTAQFSFIKTTDQLYAVYLDSIHVL